MKTWASRSTGLLLVAAFAASVYGQAPAVPGVPAAPAAPATAAAAAGQAGAAGGKMHALKSWLAGCKERFCASQFGLLVTNSMQPLSALSGGILGTCCPPGPSAADLAKPPTSAQGAAARIMQDEAEAKARRAAVKYLGTVDCHYWPEAEAGLINALRADRNECVRFEAALALGRGCCCTKNVIEALSIVVSGSDRDGNPSETSERVRGAAAFALDHCVARLAVVVEAGPAGAEKPVETPAGEKPAEPGPNKAAVGKAEDLLPVHYRRIQVKPLKEFVTQARQAFDQAHASAVVVNPTGRRPQSVTEIIERAVSESFPAEKGPGYAATPPPPERPMPAAPQPAVVTSQPKTVPPQPVAIRPLAIEKAQPMPVQSPRPAAPLAPPSRPPAAEIVRPMQVPSVPVRPGTAEVVRPLAPPHAAPPKPAAPAPVPLTPPPERSGRMGLLAPLFDRPQPAPVQVPTTPARPIPQTNVTPRPLNPVVPAHAVAGSSGPARITPTGLPSRPTTVDPRLQQVVQTLQNSSHPEHREWAASQLGGSELRTHPEVVPALVKAAREDRDATVRGASVRALGKMNANSPAVVAALQTLRTDADPRVRHDAAQVLARFGHGPSAFAEQVGPTARP